MKHVNAGGWWVVFACFDEATLAVGGKESGK